MSYHSSWVAACVVLILTGCGSPQTIVEEGEEMVLPDEVRVIAKPDSVGAFDAAKSFVHRFSGVRLFFPPGWEVGPSDPRGYLADIFLFNREAGLSVMVNWGRTHTRSGTDAAMLAKNIRELREMYGKQLSGPECIKVGDRIGYRLNIAPPVLDDSDHHQNQYFFFVDSAPDIPDEDSLTRGKYTVQVMINGGKDKLKLGDAVLFYLRWK